MGRALGPDDVLTEVARQETAALPPDFGFRISVAYFPQIGYLVVAPPRDPRPKVEYAIFYIARLKFAPCKTMSPPPLFVSLCPGGRKSDESII